MEYKIVKDISIYNLIEAGASRAMVANFESKNCLRVSEAITASEDVAWVFRWIEDHAYTKWFIEKGFIEEVSILRHKAGDKFEILSGVPTKIDGVTMGDYMCDEVILTNLTGTARTMSLETGIIGGYGCTFAADGTITNEQLKRLVRHNYGKAVYPGKVT